MALELLIDNLGGRTRVALMRGGRLQELLITDDAAPGLVGNIFRGRVQRVVPALGAAFVDFGGPLPGFLAAGDAGAPGQSDGISRLVHEGQWITVQVIADAVGDKGPRLSTLPTLSGRFMVHRPRLPGVTLSRRITDAHRRVHLRALVEACEGPGGFVVRTAALGADDHCITGEAAALIGRWRMIAEAGTAGEPRCLYRAPGPLDRALRDLGGVGDVRITVDGAPMLGRARRATDAYAPDLAGRISRHRGNRSLFETRGLEEEIERALGPRVELAGGGWISIEATAALTAIDVNAGARLEGTGREQSARRLNLLAVAEIARQLRLRNIGGQVVIDPISMRQEAGRKAVLGALADQLSHDRAVTRLLGFTALGLIELTRRRSGPTLAECLGPSYPAPAGHAQGAKTDP